MSNIPAILSILASRTTGVPGGGQVSTESCTCQPIENKCRIPCTGFPCRYCGDVDFGDLNWYDRWFHNVGSFTIYSEALSGPIVGEPRETSCTKYSCPDPNGILCDGWCYSGCEDLNECQYGGSGIGPPPCIGQTEVWGGSCPRPNTNPRSGVLNKVSLSGCSEAPCLYGCSLPHQGSQGGTMDFKHYCYYDYCCNGNNNCGYHIDTDCWDNGQIDCCELYECTCSGPCVDKQRGCKGGGWGNQASSETRCTNAPSGSFSANQTATTVAYGSPAYTCNLTAVAYKSDAFFNPYTPGCHNLFAGEYETFFNNFSRRAFNNNEIGYYSPDPACGNNDIWNGYRDYLGVTFDHGCGYGFKIYRQHGGLWPYGAVDASSFGEAPLTDITDPDIEVLQGEPLQTAFDRYPEYFDIDRDDNEQDYDDVDHAPILTVLPFLENNKLQRRHTMVMKVSGGSAVYHGYGCPGCPDGAFYNGDGSSCYGGGYSCASPDAGFTSRGPAVTQFLYEGCHVGETDDSLGYIQWNLIAKIGWAWGYGFAGCVSSGCQDTASCSDNDDYGDAGPAAIERKNGCNALGDWRSIPGRQYRMGCVNGGISPLHSTDLTNFQVPVSYLDFNEPPYDVP